MKIILVIALIAAITYIRKESTRRNEFEDDLMIRYRKSLEENKELIGEQFNYVKLTNKQTNTIDNLKEEISRAEESSDLLKTKMYDHMKEIDRLKWELGETKILNHNIEKYKRLRI